MLSKKLLRDGVRLDAACAASGTTMEAVRTAAVNAVTAFSFNELFTTIRLVVLEDELALRVDINGLKKEVVIVVLLVNGMAMETAQVEAIDELWWMRWWFGLVWLG
ncbi:hypothetical protein HanXRQr2_Chr09g0361911 [Helianthus annuus]|uniref:Uncharacterized protein n=1 Tax=Helianthus annuus TaxID=4232 RepID=A0A9K3N6F3_HELAN|nr:hypothetical protein HanXRQr2_Chr09g0361911 [Helianthus annuus]KAJ0891062.1 hypothetical protein HanPSC8_Chr09g0349201 [Helianthus annuus]